MTVQVDPGTGDAVESDRLTRLFYAELALLDIDVVRRNDHPVVPGAKGDLGTIGTIIVAVTNSTGVAAMCRLAAAWVTRSRPRSITIRDGDRSLEITGANRRQQQQAIDAFVDGLQDGKSADHQ